MSTNLKRSPLFIIFLVVFIDLVGFGIVIPILPYYAKAFGASATQMGWLMTSYSGMQFFFAPLWGRLSDHIGRRPVLLISILGSAIAMTILGFANSLSWLFFGRLFAGICGANISTATAYIADITSEENRAKGMGLIGAAFGLGFIFGPAIGGVLSRYGYSAPMFAAAGLALINVLFAYLRLPEPVMSVSHSNDAGIGLGATDFDEAGVDVSMNAASAAATVTSVSALDIRSKNRIKRFDWKAISQSLGDHRTRTAILLFFIVTFAFTQMEVTFAYFMKERHGYDAQGAGWLLAFMGAIMVLVQGGIIGKLSKRFGERRLVMTGTLAMGIALVVMAQLTHVGLAFFSAMTLLALGNGINNPSLSSLASKGSRPDRRGATMGVYQSAGSLARVLGPPLAGFAYDRFGMESPFLFAAALMVMTGAGMLATKN